MFRAGFPLLLFALSFPLRAQPDPVALLQRAVVRVRQTLDRLPDYVCRQTVDRSETWMGRIAIQSRLGKPDKDVVQEDGCDWFVPPQPSQRTVTGRLRVDVVLTNEGERYSWAGESRFENKEMLELAPLRENSSGAFGGLLRSIFAVDTAFDYRGETMEQGRALRVYAFRVPRERSEYWFGTGSSRHLVACEGTFLLDPETADLVTLIVRSSDPPALSGACRARTTVHYTREEVNGSDILLPSQSLFEFVGSFQSEVARNSSVYSDCRPRGGGTVGLNAPVGGAKPGAGTQDLPALSLPEGLPFRIVFTEAISKNSVAAGDTIAAKLGTPIEDSSKHVLVPAGTTVVARILDVNIGHGGKPRPDWQGDTQEPYGRRYETALFMGLIFRLESILIGGAPHSFAATTAQRVVLGDDDNDNGLVAEARHPDDGPLMLAPNVAFIQLYDIPDNFALKAGKVSKWRTGGTDPTLDCLTAGKCK